MAVIESVHISHQVLLPEEPASDVCDVCGEPLDVGGTQSDDDDSSAFAGRGLYVWSRGGEPIYEEVPLCASCGIAIGVSALARWEIEEEEG
jgi:hypothetical protein